MLTLKVTSYHLHGYTSLQVNTSMYCQTTINAYFKSNPLHLITGQYLNVMSNNSNCLLSKLSVTAVRLHTTVYCMIMMINVNCQFWSPCDGGCEWRLSSSLTVLPCAVLMRSGVHYCHPFVLLIVSDAHLIPSNPVCPQSAVCLASPRC